MPKRAARRPVRRPPVQTARSSSMPSADPTRRWWKSTTGRIVSLGALATAIGAILALWPGILALLPKPDPEDSARFTAVHVTSRVPLSEYRQRSTAMAPQGLRGLDNHGALAQITEPAQAANDMSPSSVGPFAVVRRLYQDSTTSSATDPDTDTSAPESSSSDDTAPPSTATSSTGATPPSMTGPPATSDIRVLSPATPLAIPSRLKREDARTLSKKVVRLAKDQVTGCAANPDCKKVADFIGIGHALDLEGNPVAPGVAAERVVKVLKDARTTQRKEPLGVVVSVDVELAGLRDKPVLLSWSMWQKNGTTRRLYGNWLNRNLAYRLKASTDRDTATLDLWIPLPKPPGPYFVRMQLTASGSARASTDSQPFD
jgi:hypothetical protein